MPKCTNISQELRAKIADNKIQLRSIVVALRIKVTYYFLVVIFIFCSHNTEHATPTFTAVFRVEQDCFMFRRVDST